ncbi:hypothetical protein ACFL0Z_01445 [Patescibacteria group bacterium]
MPTFTKIPYISNRNYNLNTRLTHTSITSNPMLPNEPNNQTSEEANNSETPSDKDKKKLKPKPDDAAAESKDDDDETKTKPEQPDKGRFGFSGETADYND